MIKLLPHVPVVRRMFSSTMTGFLLFSSLARSEESPIWVNAKVLENAPSTFTVLSIEGNRVTTALDDDGNNVE